MSTYRFSVPINDLVMAAPGERHVVYTYGETFAHQESAPFHPAVKSNPRAQRKHAIRTIRRLKGILLEMQGNEARVALSENGKPIMYDLPADQIRKAGIEMRNQPFQMDEIETEDDDGNMITGYRFIPLATPADAYTETLNFDAERKRKRDLILKKFGKPQN